MSDCVAIIEQRLTAALQPTFLEIQDDSVRHHGHQGNSSGGGHYHVLIGSDQFKGLKTIAAHRLIYKALDELIPDSIHALKITLYTAP